MSKTNEERPQANCVMVDTASGDICLLHLSPTTREFFNFLYDEAALSDRYEFHFLDCEELHGAF